MERKLANKPSYLTEKSKINEVKVSPAQSRKRVLGQIKIIEDSLTKVKKSDVMAHLKHPEDVDNIRNKIEEAISDFEKVSKAASQAQLDLTLLRTNLYISHNI